MDFRQRERQVSRYKHTLREEVEDKQAPSDEINEYEAPLVTNHDVSSQHGYLISHRWGWLHLADAPALRLAAIREEFEFLGVELREDDVAAGSTRLRDDAQPVGGEAAPNRGGHPGDGDDGEVLRVEDQGVSLDVAVVVLLGAAEDGEPGVVEAMNEAEGVATPG